MLVTLSQTNTFCTQTHLLLLVGGSLGGGLLEAGALLELRLRAVLVQELEQLRRRVLVERVRELGDRGGHLQALGKDDLLALEADVFGPLHEAGEVGLRADVLACRAVSSYATAWHDLVYAPIPKLRGRASKRGFFLAFVEALAPKGAAAGFLPVPFLGAWSLRRVSTMHREDNTARLGALTPATTGVAGPAHM